MAHNEYASSQRKRLGGSSSWCDYCACREVFSSRWFVCIIDGELPIGGLSSSAAVIITFLSALCELNSIHLSAHELITISKEAENKYVGVSCGKLDQS